MTKDIWHTRKKIPCGDQYVVVKHLSGQYSVGPAFDYGMGDYEKWAYFNDLLALDRTRKALDVAVERLSLMAHETFQGEPSSINMGFHVRAEAALADIYEITALEQKGEM